MTKKNRITVNKDKTQRSFVRAEKTKYIILHMSMSVILLKKAKDM